MAVQSLNHTLNNLLSGVESGRIQLPDFQRDWVWDDDKICKLIESIASGFPMGAVMFLETGNSAVRFSYRPFTGAKVPKEVEPERLVLDGQQRLTTLFQIFMSEGPALVNNGGKEPEKRYYYLDIKDALDPNRSMLEAVVSVPESKILTENIGRGIKLDLSTKEKEFEHMKFPLKKVYEENGRTDWLIGLMEYDASLVPTFKTFLTQILKGISEYQLPVITLTKDTSKEAVCQIFENVNTGGVKLTVFELITASFAAEEYNIREDWEKISSKFVERNDILKGISSTNFLTAMTLLASYKRSKLNPDAVVSCKKRDVLKLPLADYKECHDYLVRGFLKAADFLVHQGVFANINVPYTSQLIPLAAIFGYAEMAGINLSIQTNKDILSRWYWCGVFGELYGAANETRYVLDIVGIFNQISGGDEPDTVTRAIMQPGRLLTMQTRNSAAYNGVMALILQDTPLDFMSANRMDVATYLDESTDIHHIFPKNYCTEQKYDSAKWNSVINKTPIYASTNRSIGGRAPSEYIRTMANKGLTLEQIRATISSHKINYELLASDNFEGFIIDRATRLLDRIEVAMGKYISGRDSEETIKFFGAPLLHKKEIQE